MTGDEFVSTFVYEGDRKSAERNARIRQYCERVREGVDGFNRFVGAPNVGFDGGYGAIPTGGVALFRADQPMSVDFLDGATDFRGTSVYSVVGGLEDYDGDIMDNCTLGGAVENHILHSDPNYDGYVGSEAPRLRCMEKRDASGGGTLRDAEGEKWSAYLDTVDSSVGLYAMSIRPLLAPAEEAYCIVVANVGAGKVTEEVYDIAETMAMEGRTFGEFIKTPEYRYAERLAQRNRNRLAAQFAALCNLTVRGMGDLFSAEKRERDNEEILAPTVVRGDAALSTAKTRDAVFTASEYAQLAVEATELVASSCPDLMALELREVLCRRGVDVKNTDIGNLARYLMVDPTGTIEGNPYVTHTAAAEDDRTASSVVLPQVAEPCSETHNNRITICGRSALVYRDVVPQYAIVDGHGVAMVLSAAEGVAMQHGNDRRPNSVSPFGNADPDAGWYHMIPTSTGRRCGGEDVPWAACASCASVGAPGFLRWPSKRTGRAKSLHPHGLLDTTVPHKLTLTHDRCVVRPLDVTFANLQHGLSTVSMRSQGNTRLDPLGVVLHPQPIREFPRRLIPTV